ncbi:MAG: Mannonate dehydratase [Nitrospira sp.]|nr:Mannonate dehydratase [Nitrospira sp.]
MRLGLGQFRDWTPEYLRFAKQFGATDILLNTPSLPNYGGYWPIHDIVKMRQAVENEGLKLSAIENVPTQFYDHIMLNGPKRDEQVENMIRTVRNIARAGVPVFGYNWMPSHVWRTPPVPIRGGALATAFDYEVAKKLPLTHDREYTEAEMWKNLEYWIKIITPVAEEEGIRLGIHPCDPPVEKLGGIPQLFRNFDAYKRLISIVDSPSNAIEFCQGTFSEMNEDIYEMIEYFVLRKRIMYVHFRNVSGQVPKFYEEFVNTGYVDMHRAMRVYFDYGFDGFFIDDHVPQTYQDTSFGHRGRAHAMGYISGIMESIAKLEGEQGRAAGWKYRELEKSGKLPKVAGVGLAARSRHPATAKTTSARRK